MVRCGMSRLPDSSIYYCCFYWILRYADAAISFGRKIVCKHVILYREMILKYEKLKWIDVVYVRPTAVVTSANGLRRSRIGRLTLSIQQQLSVRSTASMHGNILFVFFFCFLATSYTQISDPMWRDHIWEQSILYQSRASSLGGFIRQIKKKNQKRNREKKKHTQNSRLFIGLKILVRSWDGER